MQEDELRKRIRFYPEPLEIALVDTDNGHILNFKRSDPDMQTEYIALIENESHNGATLVFVVKEDDGAFIKDGANWLVKLGKLAPMNAEVKWHQKIDTLIYKVGIVLNN